MHQNMPSFQVKKNNLFLGGGLSDPYPSGEGYGKVLYQSINQSIDLFVNNKQHATDHTKACILKAEIYGLCLY